jgi:hypothetical protein
MDSEDKKLSRMQKYYAEHKEEIQSRRKEEYRERLKAEGREIHFNKEGRVIKYGSDEERKEAHKRAMKKYRESIKQKLQDYKVLQQNISTC